MILKLTPPFRALTLKHNGLSPYLISNIELTIAYDILDPPDPLPPTYETTALWDTGATGSGITVKTAKEMGLVPTGRAEVKTASGKGFHSKYIVHYHLPNRVRIPGVEVIEVSPLPMDAGALIGMNIICMGDFSITNENKQTWMSFRIPPGKHIDYVKEADTKMYKKVSRNKPCFCGSKDKKGKPLKFKNCHGKDLDN